MRSYESEDIISIKSVLSRGENVPDQCHKELEIESLNKLARQQVLYFTHLEQLENRKEWCFPMLIF